MFEGLVRQLLLGYLGRYIKDFQKEQLKITFWNEEVLLENVELILEAFDYLQLPVALKRGHIGRLSIRIPWKKLGWDPIIILLEDVFFCVGPRDDHEWSADAVERRELAAKKAKLAAAELAKLSRRVSDNQAGQSLISHVTGRILDSIQVSVRNVHILYYDRESQTMLFGLRFSNLTISKQSPLGPLSSKPKPRGGSVSKIVEIHGLGIHCSPFQGSFDFMDADGTSQQWHSALTDVGGYDYVVVPFDLSLLVIKSGKLEHDSPQYSVTAELTKLAMTINPAQLKQILEFSDYMCTCQLRERFGRYRPWGCPLSKKIKGWQKFWWHYAQESILSEVRKKLKKTSWRYLGQRMDHRRKYVNLYKVKLNFLQKEKPVDEDVLFELECMEKDSDVDDILQFRSIAERELEVSSDSTSSEVMEGITDTEEKLLSDEVSSGKARGWLNWLSRGVLGAGGTDDSNQFSGVVSDEVLKDICEATKFKPVSSVNFAANSTMFVFAVDFNISEMSLLMNSGTEGQELATFSCNAVRVECKVWEESTAIIAKVGSVEVVNFSKERTFLKVKKDLTDNVVSSEKPSASIEIDLSRKYQKAELILRVVIQPIEIYCDFVFLHHLLEFYSVLGSHKSLQQRVLVSLNGIRDVKSRLLSKTEYILSSRQRVMWDVNLVNISVCLPWDNIDSEPCSMVMRASHLRLYSKVDAIPGASNRDDQYQFVSECPDVEHGCDILDTQQLNDIYEHYEVSLDDFQMTLMMPSFPKGFSVLENFCASVALAHCIIPDESILKQLKAHFIISSIQLHFSATVYSAFLSVADHLNRLFSKSGQSKVIDHCSPIMAPSYQTMPFCCSATADFKVFLLEINLEDNEDSSSVLRLSLGQLRLWYAQREVQRCSISIGEVKIMCYSLGSEGKSNIICSSRMPGAGHLANSQGIRNKDKDRQDKSLDGCFLLHYQGHRIGHFIRHDFTVHLSNIELHCYPYIVRSLAEFCDKLVVNDRSGIDDKFLSQLELSRTEVPSFGFQSFGLSNFYENGLTIWESIPLDQFPFSTIQNSGCLRNLESNMLIPDWRRYNFGDRNIKSPNNAKSRKSPVLKVPESSDHHIVASHLGTSFVGIELVIANVDLHFHDLSCIVGSITIPVGKASIISHTDSFDVLCSLEGLTLFSSWWTYNFQKFLWGPSVANRSPILNIRARRRSIYQSSSDLEISFGVQHVCCVVPPEYIAVLVGYFSLPDWTSNSRKHNVTENNEHLSENDATIYKFEILESIIMSPVEGNEDQLLKLEVQQLYCSFIHNDSSGQTLNDLFSGFSIPEDHEAENAHSLNVFGRDLCLSLLVNVYGPDTSSSNQQWGHESTLVQSCSFDLWLRLPDESQSSQPSSSSIWINTKIASCELAGEDTYFFIGLQALLDVVDQHSLIEKRSRCFTRDVPEFLQLTKSLKDSAEGLANTSGTALIDIRCCVDSLAVKLISSKGGSNSLEMIAKLDAGFTLSSTLKNDVIVNLDIYFSSLLLSSLVNSLCLAKCLSDTSFTPALEIHMSEAQKNDFQLHFVLPSLEICLHLFDWVMVIDFLYSCIQTFPQASVSGASGSSIAPVDLSAQTSPSSHSALDKSVPNAVSVTVKSENIGLSCHIPLWISDEAMDQSMVLDVQTGMDTDPSAMSGGKDSKFFTITLHSRSCELFSQENNLKIITNFEEATASVGICESGAVQSWPFFQLFQLGAKIQICDNEHVPMVVKVDISGEAFHVWLSHQVFYFWCGIDFGAGAPNSSESTFGRLDLEMQLTKVSLLLTDGRWSCNGPLIELLMRNLHLELSHVEDTLKFFTEGDLLVNYNNIHKVLWEPFVESWHFQIYMKRKCDKSALLDSGIITDIQLKSTTELNVNVTTSLIEVILRAIEMIQEARGLMQINEIPKSQRLQNYQCVENLGVRRYASYTIYNMTSLPLVFHVYQGLGSADNIDASASIYDNTVPPGSSVPIYIDGTLEEQVFNYKSAASSEGFSKKLSNRAGHYFMTIQFEGTSDRSDPISMDLVGLTYFEVNFSQDNKRTDANSGFLAPVVFDVSVNRYSKLIQLYSTVIFTNLTSVPLELRFDIPFGMSSKVVDPIYPSEEFPLPLHLAEAGHMRWRPLGNNYLWSEVHNLSKILSTRSRNGFLRPLVCYPSHPSSYLFRCCLSVQDISLPSSGSLKRRSPRVNQSGDASDQQHNCNDLKTRFIHRVTLTTPLTVKNCLPQAVSVTIDGGGVSHTVVLSEVEGSFFHVDSSHDLAVTFNIAGFRPSTIKFPRAETFNATAKPGGIGLSLTETITFGADSCDGPIYVTVEKMMDMSSGARELCVSVPFLLYNCTGFPLTISKSDHELGNFCTVPSCYDTTEQGIFIDRKDGLCLISSEEKLHPRALNFGNQSYFSKTHIISPREIIRPPSGKLLTNFSVSQRSSIYHQPVNQSDLVAHEASLNSLNRQLSSSSEPDSKASNIVNNEVSSGFINECLKAKPFMYSPDPSAVASEIMVRVSRWHAEYAVEKLPGSLWSSTFFLVAPSGSTTVLVPQPSTNSAAVISVTSHLLDGPLTGRTRAITFQPRYVISNACRKTLCFKQKGSEIIFHLGVGQHSHLHWMDTTRELLVAVRFDEPGWQWSGSFLPDHLGDTQVKMRNYVSGALNIVRVEVQNADVIRDEKIIGNTIGNSGTIFILLSDDDTGFVPYRVDNFSKETLRIYQQKCETLETIVHPYTSCPYAWDEPSYPHRLIVEVPGERIVGSYNLDEAKEYAPVRLSPSSSSLLSKKHDRTLLSSVHAEGAMKVLSIIDSSCHVSGEGKNSSSLASGKKNENKEVVEMITHYKEKISVRISFIGISLINSYPQELLYASVKDIKVDILQSMKHQKFSFQISSLQIDNQLRGTPYPVILSFNEDYKGSHVSHVRNKDGGTMTKFESLMPYASGPSCEPVVYFVASKWRNKEMTLVSFEHISLRIGDLRLELDLELLLKLLDLFKANPLLNSDMPTTASRVDSYVHKLRIVDISYAVALQDSQSSQVNGDHQFPKMDYSQPNTSSLPEIVPVGAPGQKIFLLARRQNKIYVEAFTLAPVKMTLSFSSNPWMLKKGGLTSGESLIHRGIMAFADVEGAQICLKELTITHHMASWESIQQILVKHYTRQFLHEMYKVFGSAGVIGNPMGFARRVGLGVKDFLSVPARGVLQSPSGLISGMAQGTSSLLSNTLYAVSDTATQFSKAAHKGILAFTFDDHDATKMEKQRLVASSQTKGVVSELLEGLTGLLQSPIKGAEKHGLPGVLSGFALGVTGLVARPAASVLEVTGTTAQSIRNRSRLHRMGLHHLRVRLPRYLSADSPLRPYSWEEAVGIAVLLEVDDGLKFKDEVLVMCKSLNDAGKFVVLTEKLILIIECSSLADLGKPEFRGVVAEPEWIVEVEIALESVIHADVDGGVVHIVGSISETPVRPYLHHQKRSGAKLKRWNQPPTPLPLFQTNLELSSKEEAEYFLRVLLSTIEQGKEQGWGNVYLLHQSNLKLV